MPVVFIENYSKFYYASHCSMSTCVCGILAVFAILLPFFTAFATDNFWTNISTFYEQPLVTFNNQFIIHVLQDDDSYFYSSVLKLNDYYDNVLPVPLVKTQVIDSNNDGYNDLFKIKIIFASNPSSIRNIKLLFFFKYILQKKVKLIMQTMCMIDIDTPVGVSYLYTNGYLGLNQKSPISSGTIAKLAYNTDIFNNDTSPYDFIGMYKEFAQRNLTTSYIYEKLLMPYRSNRETEMEIEITIPSYQEVIYVTPIMLTLKMAWIQYLAIFIPTAVIIYLICLFIFRYQIFTTSVISDLPFSSSYMNKKNA